MKLFFDRKSKDPIYYIQMGIRNGKKTTTKNVQRIGKHSELLAITDDPLTYAKLQVQQFNDDYKNGKMALTFNVNFDEKLTFTGNTLSKSTLLNVGYFILQRIYHDLHLADFFKPIQTHSKATFDMNLINRFLTFARVLDPQSKRSTFDRLDTYYEQPDFDYHHILRFMDVLEQHYDSYLEHLFDNSENVFLRNTSVCYFDCTNFYFEIEQEDPNYVDEVTGETVKGFRKYGPSKQHQPLPLVQMGLFIDGNGIPISMCLNSGSDNEQLCALPLEKKIIKMVKGQRFIYCADAGLGSYSIRKFNSMGGRAFIITQSIKKLSDVLQKAIFNDFEYKLLSNDSPVTIEYLKTFDKKDEELLPFYNDVAYKVIIADKAVDVGLYEEKTYKNGKTVSVKSKAALKQRVIITFSRKMMEYQRNIRNAQIERARRILNHGNVEDVKKGPHDVTRFIKRISTGEKGEKAVDHYQIDQTIIDNEEKYDGYYATATNLSDPAKDILEINAQRYKIEDCFRVLKSYFDARPVHHRAKRRIVAHFQICYTALLIYRLLENKLDEYGTHFTTDTILETLKNMNVVNNQDLFYAAAFTESACCTALNGLYDLGLDKKYYQSKDLNKKIKKFA